MQYANLLVSDSYFLLELRGLVGFVWKLVKKALAGFDLCDEGGELAFFLLDFELEVFELLCSEEFSGDGGLRRHGKVFFGLCRGHHKEILDERQTFEGKSRIQRPFPTFPSEILATIAYTGPKTLINLRSFLEIQSPNGHSQSFRLFFRSCKRFFLNYQSNIDQIMSHVSNALNSSLRPVHIPARDQQHSPVPFSRGYIASFNYVKGEGRRGEGEGIAVFKGLAGGRVDRNDHVVQESRDQRGLPCPCWAQY